ncbi:MAG TPA: hypothetical protein VHR45_11215 [Thermoanaerobaculia bacterium]|nr:hypothetical protein [Thermoanaerobaculia bacterium]
MPTDDPHAARPAGGRASAQARALAGGLCLLACALLAAGWAARPLVHDDLFGHLRTGEWIARQHQVPLHDLFSYTRLGERWVTHEWGFSLLAYALYRAAGYGGLIVLTVALALGIGAAVSRRALASIAPLASTASTGRARPPSYLGLGMLLALGLWAVAPELFLRAALAGELLLAACLLLLTRFGRTGDRRCLIGLVALVWLWSNLHSGVIFGLYVLALFALEALAGALLVPRFPRLGAVVRGGPAAPYLATLAAAAAASLLNPNGADALLYPLRLGRLLFGSGIDWELGQFAAASPRGNLAFALLAALLLLGLLPPRQVRWLSLAELLALASFFALSFRTYRLVFDFTILAIPAIFNLYSRRREAVADPQSIKRRCDEPAEAYSKHPSDRPPQPLNPLPTPPGGKGTPPPSCSGEFRLRLPASGRSERAPSRALAGLAGAARLGAAAVLAATAAGVWAARPAGLIDEHFPAAALRFLRAERIDGHLFNHQNYGGYLSWRLRLPVFWDGRNDVFASLVREVAQTPFEATVRRYAVDALLITELEYRSLLPELAAGRWRLVYWDDFCAIYLPRQGRHAGLAPGLDHRLFPPFGGRPGLASLALDPALAAAARRELDSVLAANPAAQRALYFKGVISLYRGELGRARAELLAARGVRPSDQVELALRRLDQAAAPTSRLR